MTDDEREKYAMVDAWGGWRHRRWEVLYNADDTDQLERLARDLDLKSSSRHFGNAVIAIAAKDGPIHGQLGCRRHPAEVALEQLGIVDHSRMFSVPYRKGAQPGAILLQPYMGGLRDGGSKDQALQRVLDAYRMDLRVIAHTPYNEGTVGLLLFRASDEGMLDRLERSVDYVRPADERVEVSS